MRQPRRGLSVSTQCRATSTTAHSTTLDPAETEAMQCLEEGTQKLEEGDVQAAKALYQRSVDIKRTASSLFNLGVTHYHLKEYDEAIAAWKESIALQPSSPDAHTNLASAYIISPVSRPDLALHHLHVATTLSPEDPEIAFNYAAVLEACGRLEEALEQYKRSKEFGVDRAAMHIRNVSAKILGKKLQAAEAQSKGDSESSN
ncbi:TPR-like protein [Wolfiporia cocos MD-104 SS10]|uniref:TPR-like protein n=1 Tax=Wolfiporia cocos (strain MD-104) TaxID=742152 RepID=A0A2H3JS72_WOLCO|nr:TPR-like protein [Wolfiporia cocos MD-104 SS10]